MASASLLGIKLAVLKLEVLQDCPVVEEVLSLMSASFITEWKTVLFRLAFFPGWVFKGARLTFKEIQDELDPVGLWAQAADFHWELEHISKLVRGRSKIMSPWWWCSSSSCLHRQIITVEWLSPNYRILILVGNPRWLGTEIGQNAMKFWFK